jgi:hypothetical protein
VDRFEKIYKDTGDVLGGLSAVITFFAVYWAAVESVGWVIGIALGWIPAQLAALFCFFAVKYLWLPALLLIGLAIADLM